MKFIINPDESLKIKTKHAFNQACRLYKLKVWELIFGEN